MISPKIECLYSLVNFIYTTLGSFLRALRAGDRERIDARNERRNAPLDQFPQFPIIARV